MVTILHLKWMGHYEYIGYSWMNFPLWPSPAPATQKNQSGIPFSSMSCLSLWSEHISICSWTVYSWALHVFELHKNRFVLHAFFWDLLFSMIYLLLRFNQTHFHCFISLIKWEYHNVFIRRSNGGQLGSFWPLQHCCYRLPFVGFLINLPVADSMTRIKNYTCNFNWSRYCKCEWQL